MMKSQLFYIYNYTVVKIRLFRWWCVCCIVLLTLCVFCCFLRARHDHNKIAPCGMIKVFGIELNTLLLLTGVRAQELCEEGGGLGSQSFPIPFFPPSLISHTVSLDEKHHERKTRGCSVYRFIRGTFAGENQQTKELITARNEISPDKKNLYLRG